MASLILKTEETIINSDIIAEVSANDLQQQKHGLSSTNDSYDPQQRDDHDHDDDEDDDSSDGDNGNLLSGELIPRRYGIVGEESDDEVQTTSEESSETATQESFSALVDDGFEFSEFMSSSYTAVSSSSSSTKRHEEEQQEMIDESSPSKLPLRSIPPLSSQPIDLIRSCMINIQLKSPSSALEAHASALTKARLRLGDEITTTTISTTSNTDS